MILFFVLLVAMFLALVVQHFIGPLPPMGARVIIMPLIMFYGALALPLPAMLALTFVGGLMWDALHSQMIEGNYEIALGWSIVLYAVLRDNEHLAPLLNTMNTAEVKLPARPHPPAPSQP